MKILFMVPFTAWRFYLIFRQFFLILEKIIDSRENDQIFDLLSCWTFLEKIYDANKCLQKKKTSL